VIAYPAQGLESGDGDLMGGVLECSHKWLDRAPIADVAQSLGSRPAVVNVTAPEEEKQGGHGLRGTHSAKRSSGRCAYRLYRIVESGDERPDGTQVAYVSQLCCRRLPRPGIGTIAQRIEQVPEPFIGTGINGGV
jgi:hypothetical protein